MHIVFDCVDFIKSRNIHFNVNGSTEPFEKVPSDIMALYFALFLLSVIGYTHQQNHAGIRALVVTLPRETCKYLCICGKTNLYNHALIYEIIAVELS